MLRLGVWKVTDINEATATTGRKPISLTWVDIDKEDLLRTRLVVNATKGVSSHGRRRRLLFDFTPLETARMLCSLMMSSVRPTQADDPEDDTILGFRDISCTPELPKATRGRCRWHGSLVPLAHFVATCYRSGRSRLRYSSLVHRLLYCAHSLSFHRARS